MKFLSIVLLLLINLNIASGQSVKKVLFIGNSYTASNNLPNMIYQAALSTQDSLIYDANTPGGYRFLNHVANTTTINKIYADDWDFVTLQAQSQEPSWEETQMQDELFPYAKTLCDTIRQNNACTQPLFYNTWGRKNGDDHNCNFIPWVCTYEGMDSALAATYTRMAQNNKTEISPVGLVWRYIREHYPSIELYTSDESHPSLAGSYAAACTFYTLIFKKDPTQITWAPSLGAGVADSIRYAAKVIAYDSLSKWDHSDLTANTGFTYSTTDLQVSFMAEGQSMDSLHWDFGDGNGSNQPDPMHQYSSNGTYEVTLTVYKCGRAASETQSIVLNVLSIDGKHLSNVRFTISPNPANHKLQVQLDHHYSQVTLSIINSLGQVVKNTDTFNNHKHTVDVSVLPAGVYYLMVNINSTPRGVTKFIKE